MKKVYDFTKHSQNYKYIEAGDVQPSFSLENLEYEEKRCDSRLKEEDLKLLEIELKRKQKRRIKRERQIVEGGNFNNQNHNHDDEEEEERKEEIDENGNRIRRGDQQFQDRLIDENDPN